MLAYICRVHTPASEYMQGFTDSTHEGYGHLEISRKLAFINGIKTMDIPNMEIVVNKVEKGCRY